jgi:DNA-binding CsgD family transcriptional regulator
VLIGRKPERATLRSLVENAREGHGGALLVTGEPGIGKTALLEDLATTSSEVTLLRAAGRESQAELPFGTLAELLQPARTEIDRLPGVQSGVLRQAVGIEPGTGVLDHTAVAVATLGVLAMLASRRPVLGVVDDLQWVDEPSRAALLFSARRLVRLHVALVLAARDGGGTGAERRALPGLATMELAGLKPRESGDLLGESARVPLGARVRKQLLDLAGGNPLALVELPAALSDAQLRGDDPLGEPIPVNGGIERTFGLRVARLPEHTRRALLVAAAAGSDSLVVESALERDGLTFADLGPAVRDGLVTVGSVAVSFRHPLVRSVAYHVETPEERRRAHALLASVEPDPDRRAWHRAGASAEPDEEVAAEIDAAAGRALARGAPASAARAFEVSARLTPEAGARGTRLARAARAAHRAGDTADAARLAAAARRLAADPTTLADLLLVESDLRMRDGDLEGAHRALTAQAELVAEVDPRRAATMLLLASKLRVFRLEAQAAVAEVERALELLPEGEHELVHLAALSMSRTVAGEAGALDSALAAMTAAARAPHGHAHTLGIAWPLVWLEEYDLAREVTDRSIRIQREAGFLLYLPQSLLARAELDFRTGAWDVAIAEAREALELFEETRQPAEAASAAAVLARMAAAQGDAEECRALTQRALASDVEFGLRSSAAQALAAVGLLELGLRRPQEAIAPLETATRIATVGAVGEPWLLMCGPDLVEALAHAGQQARAREALEGLRAQADALHRVSAQAASARGAGIVDDAGRWQDAFEEALALHDRMPTPFERARTELCYAERLRRARKRAEARALLRSALEVFDALGAAPWSERARAELRASGQTARRRSTPVDALTPQEREVARLVVGGATNREAAAGLYVTAKTIEFHLGNVYRKLGVRTRTELVRSFAEKLS